MVSWIPSNENLDNYKIMENMNNERIAELERKIGEMRDRIPPHSVPPRMLEELEELEEELERLKGK